MTEELEFHPERYTMPTRPAWHHAPAANTIAQVVFAGVANQRHVVYKVLWSYDDFPTGGQITVSTGGEVLHQFDVFSAGPGWIPIKVVGKLNQNLVVRLAAGGAAVTGKISVEKHWMRYS
jgi:hypothetical protein